MAAGIACHLVAGRTLAEDILVADRILVGGHNPEEDHSCEGVRSTQG